MVTTGSVNWQLADSGARRKEELIFPPLQLQRTTAKFLTRAIVHNFGFVCPLLDMLREGEKFNCMQWLVVADAAAANCKALPHLFTFLLNKCEKSLAHYSPCLLHQLARLLVLTLEREGLCSHLAS